MNAVIFFSRQCVGGVLLTALGATAHATFTPTATTIVPKVAMSTGLTTPVFVLNSLDANISMIDPKNWKEIKRIPTGKEPHHLYLTPDSKSLIVANALGDSLTFIEPKTGDIQRIVRGILDPYHLRFSPDMKWFVVAGNRLNHVDVYSWNAAIGDLKLIKRIPTAQTPSHMTIDSKSTTVYVTMQDSDELVAIDLATQTVKWRMPTGASPADVYSTPDDKYLLVGLTGGDSVEVFEKKSTGVQQVGYAPKLIKTIPTGKGAHAFRSAGDGKHVFVSNRIANTISKMNMETLAIVATYPVGSNGPDCMEVSANGKQLLVTARWSRQLAVIDLTTGKVSNTIAVGSSPHGVWTLQHANR